MSNLGIKTQDFIQIVERRGDERIIHNGLVMGISMHPSLAGANGEPAVNACVVLPDSRLHGSADWHMSLKRLPEVVHSSHKDWVSGAVQLCYEERTQPVVEPPEFVVAARAGHAAKRVLCYLLGAEISPSWNAGTPRMRDSMMAAALAVHSNPTITGEELHALWLSSRVSEGWQYGPVLDRENKISPYLVPWEELPPQHQARDLMFAEVARGVYDYPALPIPQPFWFTPPPPKQAEQSQPFPDPAAAVSAGAPIETTGQVAVAGDSAAQTTDLVNQLEKIEQQEGIAGTPGSMEAIANQDAAQNPSSPSTTTSSSSTAPENSTTTGGTGGDTSGVTASATDGGTDQTSTEPPNEPTAQTNTQAEAQQSGASADQSPAEQQGTEPQNEAQTEPVPA